MTEQSQNPSTPKPSTLSDIAATEESARKKLANILPYPTDSPNYASIQITVNIQGDGRYLAQAKYELKPGVTGNVQKPGTGSAPGLDRLVNSYRV